MRTPTAGASGDAACTRATSVSSGRGRAPGVTNEAEGFSGRSISFSNASALPETAMTTRNAPAARPTHWCTTSRTRRTVGAPRRPAPPAGAFLSRRRRHPRDRGTRLFRGADRVEAAAQRIHQVDDLRRRLDLWRDDLTPFDLRVDDLAQADLIVVVVFLQVDFAFERADDLLG